mmetsp:Transcript_317/g.1246  ORF Transcript_317/g.1246 Transcript_317/m.1246 type:complete len:474 (-) Transcript_317:514-1935(-)
MRANFLILGGSATVPREHPRLAVDPGRRHLLIQHQHEAVAAVERGRVVGNLHGSSVDVVGASNVKQRDAVIVVGPRSRFADDRSGPEPALHATASNHHPPREERVKMVGFLTHRDPDLGHAAAEGIAQGGGEQSAGALLVRGAVAPLPKVDDVVLPLGLVPVGVLDDVRVSRVEHAVRPRIHRNLLKLFNPPDPQRPARAAAVESATAVPVPSGRPRRHRGDVDGLSRSRSPSGLRRAADAHAGRRPSVKRLLEQRRLCSLLDHLHGRVRGEPRVARELRPPSHRALALRRARAFSHPRVRASAADQDVHAIRREEILGQPSAIRARAHEFAGDSRAAALPFPLVGGGAPVESDRPGGGGVDVVVGSALLCGSDRRNRSRGVDAQRGEKVGHAVHVPPVALVDGQNPALTPALLVPDGEEHVERLGSFPPRRAAAVELDERLAEVQDEDVAGVEGIEREGRGHDPNAPVALDV